MLAIPERRALRLDVRDALTRAVTDGRFQPGERIIESRVARELGVSQTTVREALRDLESTGLVVYATNRGCVVRKLSRTDVAEMYEMRALLEGEAARLAISRLGPDDLTNLDQLVDEMIRLGAAEEMSDMIEVDIRFHQAICRASGHGLLYRLWSTINPALWTHLAVVGILGIPLIEIARRHRPIVEALRAGDPVQAEHVVVEHLLDLRDLALQRLSE